jgi:DNA polymerase-4
VHLNVADFAVAVERLSQPGLHDRPVIVAPLGSARARVYDMSEEAFQAGIRKHMPLERARRLCRGARIVPPRPHRYERAMLELYRLAQPFSPLVESEDDTGHVFLDMSGTRRLFGPPQDVGARLRKEARKRLGLDPIWGLAANKMLAKAATRVTKPSGGHVVLSGQEETFLRPLPLHLLPGLEAPDLALLGQYNLRLVEHALAWRVEHFIAVLGRRGAEIYHLLRGRDQSPVLPVGLKPPVVRLDHEFSEDTNTVPEVERSLFLLAERAGAALRRMGKAARRVAVFLTYSDGARAVRQRSHALGTANDFLLFDLAQAALQTAWLRRVRLRHLRLVCDRLINPPAQLDLPLALGAEQQREARREKLVTALDRIRGRHGSGSIRLGRGLSD